MQVCHGASYTCTTMNTKVLNYRVIVEREKQGKEFVYVSYVPSLGISDFGKTVDEAVKNTEKAIKLYVEALLNSKQSVPEPDSDDYFITSRKVEIKNAKVSIA